MIDHKTITDHELHRQIREGSIKWAGYKKARIYGKLSCGSGKRMLRENRVFFHSEQEAIDAGYRPCGNCMKQNSISQFHGF